MRYVPRKNVLWTLNPLGYPCTSPITWILSNELLYRPHPSQQRPISDSQSFRATRMGYTNSDWYAGWRDTFQEACVWHSRCISLIRLHFADRYTAKRREIITWRWVTSFGLPIDCYGRVRVASGSVVLQTYQPTRNSTPHVQQLIRISFWSELLRR